MTKPLIGEELSDLFNAIEQLSSKRQLAYWRALCFNLAVAGGINDRKHQIAIYRELVETELKNKISPIAVSNQPEA